MNNWRGVCHCLTVYQIYLIFSIGIHLCYVCLEWFKALIQRRQLFHVYSIDETRTIRRREPPTSASTNTLASHCTDTIIDKRFGITRARNIDTNLHFY